MGESLFEVRAEVKLFSSSSLNSRGGASLLITSIVCRENIGTEDINKINITNTVFAEKRMNIGYGVVI